MTAGKDGEKQEPFHCWWECKLVQSLWKTVWRFLKQREIELPYDPVIPLLSIYPAKLKFKKDTYASMLIAALFTIAKTQKQSRLPSIDEQKKKMWCVYIKYSIEYYLAIKKNGIMPLAST